MLENTGHAEVKVPNTLALVAAEAVVEQARKFQEQSREAIERRRAEERARVDNLAQTPREDAVKVSIETSDAASASSPATETAPPVEPASRGASLDLSA